VWPVALRQGAGGGKRPERLTGDGRQCRGGMPGAGRGLGAAGRGPCSQPEKTGHRFRSRGSRG